jgi:hypothetical protein
MRVSDLQTENIKFFIGGILSSPTGMAAARLTATNCYKTTTTNVCVSPVEGIHNIFHVEAKNYRSKF